MNPKNSFQLILATVLCLAGLLLLFAGFYTAPRGEIHHSVLIAFGETATFAGGLIGIDYSYRSGKKPGP